MLTLGIPVLAERTILSFLSLKKNLIRQINEIEISLRIKKERGREKDRKTDREGRNGRQTTPSE